MTFAQILATLEQGELVLFVKQDPKAPVLTMLVSKKLPNFKATMPVTKHFTHDELNSSYPEQVIANELYAVLFELRKKS